MDAPLAPPVADLQHAAAAAGAVVSGVRADHWHAPTPCSEWTVGQLLAHVVNGNRSFAAAVRNEPGASTEPVELTPETVVIAYDAASAELVAAFAAGGALERSVTVPFATVPGAIALHLRTTELLVHGWDLAVATGQRIDAPTALAAQELAFTRQALAQVPAERSPFDPPRPTPADATELEQLVSWLGRDVARWRTAPVTAAPGPATTGGAEHSPDVPGW